MAPEVSRLPLEYVVPLKWAAGTDPAEMTAYLASLSAEVDVTVVDGSEPGVWAGHHRIWGETVRHLRPDPWPGRNGKVAGVVTGVRQARHELVVVADDDVRWRREELEQVVVLLADADLVRPQNVFDPLPWHARWDTARSLLNRAWGADYPGTYGLRRSTFCAMGGYDGDVLFENLEMARTFRAAGGVEVSAPDLFVRRLPPATGHFWSQRTRQAYDDFAQPLRLAVEGLLLPLTGGLAGLAARPGRRRGWARAGLAAEAVVPVLLAELGRRRGRGRRAFPPTAALWAPLWLAERAVCVWLAVGWRLAGGVPYAGRRLVTAAHSTPELRRRLSLGAPGAGRRTARTSEVRAVHGADTVSG
jgi:hypothetical protein